MIDLARMKEKLLAKQVVLGTVIRSADVSFAELVGITGFDFGWIDMEHAPLSFADVQTLVITLENQGCVAVVRVPNSTADQIGKALDLGAAVVTVPHVDTPEIAEHVVRGAKYFPLGRRGYASCSRSNRQGTETLDEATMRRKNDDNMVMVQIESKTAVRNADDIARVDGVDILFLGLGDLSQDLGVPSRPDNEKCLEAIETVAAAARRHNKTAAAAVMKPEALDKFLERGFTMITCAVDVLLMRDALKERLSAYRKIAGA